MKKLFMVLCIVIMFFGIVGCPSSDDPANTVSKTNYSTPAINTGTGSVIDTSGGPGANPVPEPTTLILLGTGLVGLAGYGRKRFKK
jgi:hypothetical protein